MITTCMFVAGLVLASFLGATIWRIQNNGKNLGNRSVCEHCRTAIKVYDLLPILGWLIQRGKCRHCNKRIDYLYPLSEFLTGSIFLLSWLYWPQSLDGVEQIIQFGLWLAMSGVLVWIALIDIRTLEIENFLIYPLIALAIAWRFLEAIVFGGGAESMRQLTLGLIVGGGLFLALFYISKEKWIGGGDVKIGFFLGAWLGPSAAAVALGVGFYSAALLVVPLLLLRVIKRKQPVPFGPFLVAGVMVSTIWGAVILDWFGQLYS